MIGHDNEIPWQSPKGKEEEWWSWRRRRSRICLGISDRVRARSPTSHLQRAKRLAQESIHNLHQDGRERHSGPQWRRRNARNWRDRGTCTPSLPYSTNAEANSPALTDSSRPTRPTARSNRPPARPAHLALPTSSRNHHRSSPHQRRSRRRTPLHNPTAPTPSSSTSHNQRFKQQHHIAASPRQTRPPRRTHETVFECERDAAFAGGDEVPGGV